MDQPLIILLSTSPSRQKALAVLLGILQHEAHLILLDEFSEIPSVISVYPAENVLFVIDNWIPNIALTSELVTLKQLVPHGAIVVLLEDEGRLYDEIEDIEMDLVFGSFEVDPFLELIRKRIKSSKSFPPEETHSTGQAPSSTPLTFNF